MRAIVLFVILAGVAGVFFTAPLWLGAVTKVIRNTGSDGKADRTELRARRKAMDRIRDLALDSMESEPVLASNVLDEIRSVEKNPDF